MRSARLPVNLIGSPINYANRLIGSPITSKSTGEQCHPCSAHTGLKAAAGRAGHRSCRPESLPLRRGMMHYAYSRQMPIQVGMTAMVVYPYTLYQYTLYSIPLCRSRWT